MLYPVDDTIAAVASGPGGSARGIVRASGPKVFDCLRDCFAPADESICIAGLSRPRVVAGTLSLPGFAARLEADVYAWPGRRSYTRQPSIEIHTLGSPPLLQSVLAALCSAGVRPARPGEFTLRAFLAGRIDLVQAEAVLAVVDADDARTLARALGQLAGGMAVPLGQLRGDLADLLAELEAGLDFADEDIDLVSAEAVVRSLDSASAAVASMLDRLNGRSQAGDRPRVVLCGWPNAGKSSLFNALIGHEAAIVAPIAGTTRDFLRAPIQLGGLDCELIDTAGVEPTAGDAIGAAAQGLGSGERAAADLELLCIDAARPPNDWENEQLASRAAVPRIVVRTKCDSIRDVGWASSAPGKELPGVFTSAKTGAGLVELKSRMGQLLGGEPSRAGEMVPATALRTRDSLVRANESLNRARALSGSRVSEELVAAELRLALAAIGEVAGEIYTDDILDRLFSRFCIGK